MPAINLSGTGINLLSGDTMSVHLVYDGTTLTMTISDLVTAAQYSTSWTINIPSTVGSNTAYVGFTGSTGAYVASQKILTWSYSFSSSAPTATPTFTPATGTYTTAQTVQIADTTLGANIYYTTNGTTPTSSSTVYSGPVTVSSTETLEAIAIKASSSSSSPSTSAVASAMYTIKPVAATPTFSIAAGTYAAGQTVTVSDSTAGATIYYTTNGSTPTPSSGFYTGALTISATETLQAIAVSSTTSPSAIASAVYTVVAQAATPTFSVAPGTYPTSQTVTLSDATIGAKIYFTTNGATPTTSSSVYSTALTVSATETIKAIAISSATSASAVASASYTVSSSVAATPLISLASGTYHAWQTVTFTDATIGAKMYYTNNGTTPTTRSSQYSTPFPVRTTETIEVLAVAAGYSNSNVASASYALTVLSPKLSPAGGAYTGPQTVTITPATKGDLIYYTTNGTTPTVGSTQYAVPITVSSSETLEVLGAVTGFTSSPIVTQTYTINASTPAPAINFASGFTSTNINLYGATVQSGVLGLTNGGSGEEYVAWYTIPVNIQAFTTDFTFQQTAATADGFTFAIQNSPSNLWAVGLNGGGLGYSGIASSIAVKFDLYNNAGEGSDSTGFYTNGATPTLPSVDMTGSGVNLHSGDVMHAHLTYNGTMLTLLLTDTVTNASFTTSTAINIPSTVGGNTAYVGFTGGTGGQTAIQKILTWTFTPN